MFSFEYKNAYPEVINKYPKSSLGYNTNNKYPIFPPLMNDGRSVISSWNTESSLNNKIRKENGIETNWDYRRFLTKNAVEIMEKNYNETANDTGSTFITQTHSSLNTPYLYDSINEKTSPIGFENSDLKEMYLSREQLYSRKCAPTLHISD
jgi:hypothetical protein